jgi:2-desacetyl-2-hydroxyethyl bacteriochlorophyllide A dehydrogenase
MGREANYELRITNYELRITNYELRITNYELRITRSIVRLRSDTCKPAYLKTRFSRRSPIARNLQTAIRNFSFIHQSFRKHTMESLNIVFTGPSQVELRYEPVREPGPGEVLVENRSTLISTGTESICFRRNFAPGTYWESWVKYPFYPGYGSAGRVLAVGEGVTAFAPGDRIASRAQHRQYAITSVGRAVRIPDALSDEEAAWIGLAAIVQTGVRRAEHELGDAVVVIGMGLLGQLVAQYSRLMGAREVIAIDPARPRLEMAQRVPLGATQTLAMNSTEAIATVAEFTGKRMADVVYDVTGHPDVFATTFSLVRRFGKVLLLGDAGDPSQQRLTHDVLRKGVRIIGAHDVHPPAESSDYAYWTHNKMVDLFFNYLSRGQMDVKCLITNRHAPTEAADVYDLLQERRSTVMGVIFDWTKLG